MQWAISVVIAGVLLFIWYLDQWRPLANEKDEFKEYQFKNIEIRLTKITDSLQQRGDSLGKLSVQLNNEKASLEKTRVNLLNAVDSLNKGYSVVLRNTVSLSKANQKLRDSLTDDFKKKLEQERMKVTKSDFTLNDSILNLIMQADSLKRDYITYRMNPELLKHVKYKMKELNFKIYFLFLRNNRHLWNDDVFSVESQTSYELDSLSRNLKRP